MVSQIASQLRLAGGSGAPKHLTLGLASLAIAHTTERRWKPEAEFGVQLLIHCRKFILKILRRNVEIKSKLSQVANFEPFSICEDDS